MKKFQIKPRHIVLALSLLAMLIAFMVYTVCVSGKYSYTENVGAKHLEADQVHAKSSDETVAKIVSVENYTEKGNNELKVTVEGVNPGDCVVTLAYRSPENGQMLVRTSAFRVLPIGVVYDLTIDSFTSLKAVIPLGVAAMLLIVAVLSLSFREKQRNGEFYYSMVIIGGVILFLLLNVIVTLTDSQLWSRFGEAVTTKDILALIVSSGNRFVMFSEIPVIMVAASLAVSNIWLVVKEGFRLQNLLGVVIAVLVAGGILTIRLSDNYSVIQPDALYYFAMLANIGVAFLLSYFECMFLSTMFCAVASTRYNPPYDMDYIIILGCAIRKDGTPTPILRGRVQRAYDFEQEQFQSTGKHAVFVPSGGQGSDEVISESESMKRCLMEMGVPEERILKEDRSVNTYQNMAFSKTVIEQDAGDIYTVKVGFSTTNYHVFRGYTLAEKLKMRVKGLSAKTKLYFFPNAFVREFIGLLWEKKWKHLLFIFLFFAVLLVLYLIIRY